MLAFINNSSSSANPSVSAIDRGTQNSVYYPAIDGLRAVAVLLVIFCHAQFAGFAGGFIGVDIFFAISGYVVALAIFRSQDGGEFSLLGFYVRRLQRLAPSLYLVLLATIIFCARYCFPLDVSNTLKNAALVAVFYSNIYLSKQTGYFDPGADKQALLHTWSLSVEEQFYLCLPLLLILLRRMRPVFLLLSVLTLIAVTLLFSQSAVSAAVPQAYFKLQYRAFEFFIGIALAVVHYQGRLQLPAIFPDFLLLAGLALIGYTVTHFDTQTAMPGWHALLPCAATVLCIAGARGASAAGVLLSNPFAVYLGRLSYVLYLWHWPVMFALRRLQLQSSGWMATAIAAILLISVLTHHLLEQPLRHASWSRRKVLVLLFAVPVLAMSVLLAIAQRSDNFVRFYPEAYRSNYETAGRSVFDLPRAKNCWSKVAVTKPELCSVGDLGIAVNAVYWGDSHAYHQIEFMDRLGRDYHLRLHDLAFTMCPPTEKGPEKAGEVGYQRYRGDCLAHSRDVMAYILAHSEIKTVVMSAVWQNYRHLPTRPPAEPTTHGYLPGDTYMADTLTKLIVAGKRVVLLDDVPIVPAALENCLSNRIYLPAGAGVADCTYDEAYLSDQHGPAASMLADMVARFPDVKIIHTFDVPCTGGRCSTELMGVPIYRNNDIGHLGVGGSRIYYDAYVRKHPGELQAIFGAPQ